MTIANGVTATVNVTLSKTFMRHLADKIAAIWDKSHSEVLGYV